MISSVKTFLHEETGAISVDYVVLAAAAVAMSIAATDVIRGGLRDLSSNLEGQLRTQQISDAFVVFTPAHFEDLIGDGTIDEETAETLFNAANDQTNAELLTELSDYITKIVNDDMTDEDWANAYALASVAHQRNVVDDNVIALYFGGEDTASASS